MRSFGFMIVGAGLVASSVAAQTAAGNAFPSGASTGSPVGSLAGSVNRAVTSSQAVTGKPLSATEVRRTLQILGDGTRIENTDTDKLYRDDAGCIRIQRKDGSALIQDPMQDAPDQTGATGKEVRHTLPSLPDMTALRHPPSRSQARPARRHRPLPFMKRIWVMKLSTA